MTFSWDGRRLSGEGAVVAGDASRLMEYLAERHLPSEDATPDIRLSGSGGNLAEGAAIGQVLRKAGIPATVGREAVCAQACALAFLGGTRTYATGVGIGRVLEFGGTLSFRGVADDGSGGASGPDTASRDHMRIADLLAYAKEMRGIDAGILLEAALPSPAARPYLSRPAAITGLSIELAGVRAVPPPDWPVLACRKVVAKHLPALDDAGWRVTSRVSALPTVKALRRSFAAGGTDDPAVSRALAGLDDADAMDLAVGGGFSLAVMKPILDARSVALERGAGFYYDSCVTVLSKDLLSVILVDEMGHDRIFEQFAGYRRFLAMTEPDRDLW